MNKSAAIRTDTLLNPVESPLDPNLKFDSLSAYKRHLKERGYEITGGDHLRGKGLHDYKHEVDKDGIREEIREQIRLNKWGMAPLTEKDKEICHREQKQLNRLLLAKRYRVKRYLESQKQNLNQ